MTTGEAVAHY